MKDKYPDKPGKITGSDVVVAIVLIIIIFVGFVAGDELDTTTDDLHFSMENS